MIDSSKNCWSCGADRALADALCPACGKVQPPPAARTGEKITLDKFAVLGFARAFDLDSFALEERFRALSRKLHPDRFARATPRERRYSLEQTTILNDAYRALKDPVRRAEHLLELRGIHVGKEPGPRVPGQPAPAAEALPQEFLEEAMEDREKLLEAKLDGGPEAVEKLAQGIRDKRAAALREIGELLRSLESAPKESPPAPALARTAELLARMRYYTRYLDEVEGRAPEM